MKKARDLRIEIGSRLRLEREKHGLNQLELADLIGVGRYAVMKYESGVNSPSVEHLNLLDQNEFDTYFIATGNRTSLTHEDREIFNMFVEELWKLAQQKSQLPTIGSVLRAAWMVFDFYKSKSSTNTDIADYKELMNALLMN